MMVSRIVVSVAAILGVVASTALAMNIETVPVGNPGNAADTRYGLPGFGSVGYTYNIGKYEVTAGQYTAFLNAVAATDTYGLYQTSMWVSGSGCRIERQGSSGSYTYSVASDYANRPVNYVSWGDVARFANWLHNGQPTGPQDSTTTEDGAYFLNGATSDAALLAVTRKSDWKWAIASEDEWYKAAYQKNDGVTNNYFDYPTGSNTAPGNDVINPDPGNNANFYDGSYAIGSPYYRTEVGEFENSDSPYGTFDQGGNVWEWNEAIIGSSRGRRGGSFYYSGGAGSLHASVRSYSDPASWGDYLGFRVVEVPEPVTMLTLALGGARMFVRRKGLGR